MTTSARLASPRMSTATPVPAAVDSGSRNPSAIPIRREGDRVPLVTRPTSRPPARTRQPWRGTPRSRSRSPTSRRYPPRSFCARRASRPTNGWSHFTSHSEPVSRLVSRPVKSWPEGRYPFASRTVSRGPRPGARGAHAQVPVRGEAREDHVVEDPALVVEEVGVARPPRGRGDVVRREGVHEGRRPRPLDHELPHVAHVEEAGGPPDREVL